VRVYVECPKFTLLPFFTDVIANYPSLALILDYPVILQFVFRLCVSIGRRARHIEPTSLVAPDHEYVLIRGLGSGAVYISFLEDGTRTISDMNVFVMGGQSCVLLLNVTDKTRELVKSTECSTLNVIDAQRV